MANYTPIIGLEVHIEQNTESKMFCGCSASHFLVEPNTNTCPVCLGLPGALPFANEKAIENTIKFGLAFGCTIAPFSKFDRKHYFYPDLPKAFQTSQYDLPFCTNGTFENIHIRRIHLEEDTAKLQHTTLEGKKVSLVDFNRSGVPLIEMVTEPDFHDAESVDSFLKSIQLIVRYLGISTADMEKGSMRLEANISVTDKAAPFTELPNYKVELKNINSFRFLKKALEAEITRQTEALEKSEQLVQETRGFDEKSGETRSQRIKEEASDYRYFPEPDLPPILITKENVATIQSNLPELPQAKRERFAKEYGLSKEFIEVLVSDVDRAHYFETAIEEGTKHGLSAKFIANAMVNLKLDTDRDPATLIKKLYEETKVEYATHEEMKEAIHSVFVSNEEAVTKYKNGKVEIIGFLIGQTQKQLKGKGDPKVLPQLITTLLQEK